MSIGRQLYEKKIFIGFSLFFEKSKWRPNHVTNQLFELKPKRAMCVDGICQISGQSVCNFMKRRFFKVLASFSKKQNGGKSHVIDKVFINEIDWAHVVHVTQKNQLS